jgi:hypothetical protein
MITGRSGRPRHWGRELVAPHRQTEEGKVAEVDSSMARCLGVRKDWLMTPFPHPVFRGTQRLAYDPLSSPPFPHPARNSRWTAFRPVWSDCPSGGDPAVRSDRLRLMDILEAIAVIGAYLPADRSKFDNDPPVQSHICRHVVIVGEASFKADQCPDPGKLSWQEDLRSRYAAARRCADDWTDCPTKNAWFPLESGHKPWCRRCAIRSRRFTPTRWLPRRPRWRPPMHPRDSSPRLRSVPSEDSPAALHA